MAIENEGEHGKIDDSTLIFPSLDEIVILRCYFKVNIIIYHGITYLN